MKMNLAVREAENRSPNPILKHSKGSDAIDLLVFLVPCFEFVQLKIVGTLFGPEILLLSIFLYLALRGKFRIAKPEGRWLLILCSLWLASQCVTDIVRHSAFADYARGWSNIGMTIVNFSALCTLLYGRPRRLILYGWGLVLGGVLRFLITPDIYADSDPWKFGLMVPTTLAMYLLASSERCRGHWPLALSVLISVINLVLGARSVGGICLAASLYLFIVGVLRKRESWKSGLRMRLVVTITASVIVGLGGLLWAYKVAVGSGTLGDEARDKYENQSSGEYGILLGGRTEMLGYLPAIYDSPILGHGSWAKDPTYLVAERQALALMGYTNAEDISLDALQEGLIPTHSFLFGAWVDAGVLGAFCWAFVFIIVARALMRLYTPSVTLLPLMSFVGFELLWDILFSPYGAEVRIIFPYYLLIIMTCTSYMVRERLQVAASLVKRQPVNAGV